MTSTTTAALQTSIVPAFPAALKQDAPTAVESELPVEPERGAFEVTSNIRQGSRTPEAPSFDDSAVLLHRRTRDPVDDDPVFALPPPSLAPRFVFKVDAPPEDDPSPAPINDYSSDTTPPVQTPIYPPSSPPPRIYFEPSAITLAAPASTDFLERDPSVRGVPRNYRAWARTGRARLDVEGAERVQAKEDFRALGLVLPPDSDSDDNGDDGADPEKKRRRRKKKQAMKAVVPMERPRRAIRNLMETTPSATPPLQPKSVNKKVEKQAKPSPILDGQTMDDAKPGPSSKSTESESSARRSSSTLLDADTAKENKRKHHDSDKDANDTPASKKLRVSKRLTARKSEPQIASVSSQPTSEEEEDSDNASTSNFTPSRASPAFSARRTGAARRPRSSPGPRSASRKRAAPRPPPPPKLPVAGPSRSGAIPASRPGHRLSREFVPLPSEAIPIRTFPPTIPIISGYSSFYRRYPLITQFSPEDAVGRHITQSDNQPKRALGNWNPPRDHRDLYTPRYTKGSGGKKIALCPICFEDSARGGEGRQEWNHTKTSQHNYHMQYYHGISATRCAPFSPPVAHRIAPVPRPQTNEKPQILQGKCHVCKQWVALEGCKIGELKVRELLWWKHAAQCHKDSHLAGEEDIFLEDDEFRRLKEYESRAANGAATA